VEQVQQHGNEIGTDLGVELKEVNVIYGEEEVN